MEESLAPLRKPILDHRCLRCQKELPDNEKAYWKKRLEEDKSQWESESSIMRVSCVHCAKIMGKRIPKELSKEEVIV